MALFERSVQRLITLNQARIALDEVIYHRGATAVSLVKKVWTGRTPFRVMDRGNSRLIWSERDFLIPCADLVIGGVEVTPQEGDWIEIPHTNAEGTQRYEFMAPNNEPVWRYSDPQRMIYRIHAKLVKHSS